MLKSTDELRAELAALLARPKPPSYVEQRQIEQRIRLLQNYLKSIDRGEGPAQ